jgi:hypothetical protein
MLLQRHSGLRSSVAAAALLALAGCSTIQPRALSNGEVLATTQADARTARAGVPEIAAPAEPQRPQ